MSADRNAQIVQMATAGVAYGRIGELFGITRQRVYFIAKRGGVSINPNKGRHLLRERRDLRPRVRVTARPNPYRPTAGTVLFTMIEGCPYCGQRHDGHGARTARLDASGTYGPRVPH